MCFSSVQSTPFGKLIASSCAVAGITFFALPAVLLWYRSVLYSPMSCCASPSLLCCALIKASVRRRCSSVNCSSIPAIAVPYSTRSRTRTLPLIGSGQRTVDFAAAVSAISVLSGLHCSAHESDPNEQFTARLGSRTTAGSKHNYNVLAHYCTI